jgi:hypothetical protein
LPWGQTGIPFQLVIRVSREHLLASRRVEQSMCLSGVDFSLWRNFATGGRFILFEKDMGQVPELV